MKEVKGEKGSMKKEKSMLEYTQQGKQGSAGRHAGTAGMQRKLRSICPCHTHAAGTWYNGTVLSLPPALMQHMYQLDYAYAMQ